MRIIETVKEMQAWSDAERRAGKRIALVPTMGALHDGHLALVRAAKKLGDRVVASLFVNPSQFAPGEDFATYPRDFARDRALLEKEDVDILFHPSATEVYPEGYQTSVEVERLAPLLCGEFRPGHFRGVATVVAKLFNMVRPHTAIFGAKDYQQLQVIRRMVKDLDFDVEIVSHPIVRARDGLALSSRNAYLSAREREAALSLYRALQRAEAVVGQGERCAGRIIAAARAAIEAEPLAEIEYVKLCDPETLAEIPRIEREALLALAVRVGAARLIDNAVLKT
ncbi:MAG TPA: pantoate--beta-alanine ligase [Candidatus Binatia bacterium]|nr:pantoate--beta-alanine ligase [Candidatus Binatia bacterium]